MADLRLRYEDKLRAEANGKNASRIELYAKFFQNDKTTGADNWLQISQFSPKRFENSPHPPRYTERRILPFDI